MRQGGEKRGSSYSRRRRKQRMIEVYGDGSRVRCTWCPKWLTFKTVEADRIHPTGSYRFTNVLPACRRCNAKRQNTPAWQWALQAVRPRWLLLILKVPNA